MSVCCKIFLAVVCNSSDWKDWWFVRVEGPLLVRNVHYLVEVFSDIW